MPLGVVHHAYSHFKVTVYIVFQCELISVSKCKT